MSMMKLNRLTLLRNVINNQKGAICLISTSPKKSDTATISTTEKATEVSQTSTKSKNWVSYGFDMRDEKHDRDSTHASFFFSTTLCIVFGGMVWYYQPDFTKRDWAQREAYLVLRRRELAGEEPVTANYIDSAIMEQQLPSDEELGDTEIII
jgi:NADH dehydrogenase (ubiquinone) 1 beta subcomplex subunit 11